MTKVAFLSHHGSIAGAFDSFYEFIIANIDVNTTLFSQPLPGSELRSSYIKIDGNTAIEKRHFNVPMISLIIDFFTAVFFSLKNRPTIVVASNNFDTLAAIFSKYILFQRMNIIYFASDYSVKRFNNKYLNLIYINIEKIASSKADLIVTNTERAAHARRQIGAKDAKILVVPNTVKLDNPNFQTKPLQKRSFIYVGDVNSEHGLLNFLQHVGSEVFDELTIIGAGEEIKDIERFCKQNHINFYNLGQKPRSEVLNILQKFKGFGLAPYKTDETVHSYYGSPLKVIEYIACGVPVITSKTTELSSLVQREQLGIVYSDLKKESVLKDLKTFDRQNFNIRAKEFYDRFNTDTAYKPLLSYVVKVCKQSKSEFRSEGEH